MLLEAEVADLTERLETRKAVERAKSLLMAQLDLSEPEAFRWIQKTAYEIGVRLVGSEMCIRDSLRIGCHRQQV